MSEEDLEKKLNQEREKVRLNSIKTLKLLGYKNDTSKMTQEELDARIELLLEQRANQTGDATSSTPSLFQGIDEERENSEAVKNNQSLPSELDQSEYMKDYDALTALIPQLRPNSQLAHMEQLGAKEDIRIIRLPSSIKLNEQTTIIRRIVL